MSGKNSGRINQVTLQYYMERFNFSGFRLDVAFRCGLTLVDMK